MTEGNTGVKWIFFLLWPFAAAFTVLRNFFNKENQRILLAFSFLYGYSVFLESGDIIRFKQSFSDVVEYNWSDFWYLITHAFSPIKNTLYPQNAINSKPDFYALTLSFIVSRFTENPRWFWAFASLIYTKTMFDFYNYIKYEINWNGKDLIQQGIFICLVLIIPFYYGVTGVRFWPAMFIYLTYALRFLKYRRPSDFILCMTSILFHYSFILPVIFLVSAYLVPRYRIIYGALLLVCLGYAFVSSQFSILDTLESGTAIYEGTTIESSSESYTDKSNIENRLTKLGDRNWYVVLKDNIVLYALLIFAILDVLGIFKFKEDTKFLKSSFPLFVFLLSLTILTMNLGPVSRFKHLFFVMFFVRYLALIQDIRNVRKIQHIFLVVIPFVMFYSIVVFRAGFYTVDPLLLVNNSVLTFFMHSQESLSEFIIGH